MPTVAAWRSWPRYDGCGRVGSSSSRGGEPTPRSSQRRVPRRASRGVRASCVRPSIGARSAESLIGIARASEERYLPNASPLNRVAARDQLALILRTGAVLADTDRRVAPRGVILVERLITDSKSALYRHSDADLHEALEQALQALDDQR